MNDGAGGPRGPDELERHGRFRVPRRADGERLAPDVELHEAVQGSKPGSRYYRLTPRERQKLRRRGPGEFEATRAALLPATALGRAWSGVRRVFIGQPLATAELAHERLSKLKGLAIFSSDNLSSSAYATEEILLILMLAGSGALVYSVPIAFAIALLATIVVTSYRQTIRAYPNGGGAYIVAKENVGVWASFLAGAGLFVGYVLTVAVSTAAGVAAITSALPELHDFSVYMALAFVGLLTLANLRGIRESGTIFALPTYFFIFTFAAMLLVGIVRLLLGHDLSPGEVPNPIEPGVHSLSLFLLLRAFASGCAALTGVEAMANGVPYFKPPEAKNAATTLVWMAVILSGFFLGTAFLAREFAIVPSETRTVVAQIAQAVFGSHSPFFYAVQVGTALILILAANTSFAGLPVAASVMAGDRVVPLQFSFRGDRLAFSNGIIVVGVLASVLLVAFDASTHALIPLYAFGVFVAFTLSQAGMVAYWRRGREPGWRGAAAVNALGAAATGVVALIIGATKFLDGAWISIVLIGALMLIMWWIKAHYERVEEQLDPGRPDDDTLAQYSLMAGAARHQKVIIPVDQINRAVLRTVAYAKSISDNVTAIHITDDRERGDALRRRWEEFVLDTPIVVIESPFRALAEPILAYVDALDRAQADQMITVVLPEFVTRRPWERVLHNQLALRLKKALLGRPNTVVIDVPYRLLH